MTRKNLPGFLSELSSSSKKTSSPVPFLVQQCPPKNISNGLLKSKTSLPLLSFPLVQSPSSSKFNYPSLKLQNTPPENPLSRSLLFPPSSSLFPLENSNSPVLSLSQKSPTCRRRSPSNRTYPSLNIPLQVSTIQWLLQLHYLIHWRPITRWHVVPWDCDTCPKLAAESEPQMGSTISWVITLLFNLYTQLFFWKFSH